MKKLLFIISISLLAFSSEAQQIPQFSHYSLNYFGINPAVAGSKPCLDLKLGYRQQWTGVDDAPRSAFANMHGKIGKGKFNFMGLGGRVETDNTGPLSYTALDLAFAYHMRTTRKSMLSAGIAVGFQQWRIDAGAITLPETGFFDDPVLGNAKAQMVWPTIDLGLWWYREDRFIGLSLINAIERQVPDIGDDTYINRHIMLTAGKITEMGDGFFFKPSTNIRLIPGSKPSIDLTAMVDYNDKISLGVGARNGFGLVGLLKIDAFKYVTIGYAYDFSLSKMRFDGRHTHEIVLGIQACAKGDSRGIPCAAYD